MNHPDRTYTKRHRSGASTTYVKLKPGESAVILKPGQTAIVVSEDAHYKLGGQLDQIVGGHVINEARRVYWCSIDQAWIDFGEKNPETVTAP